jgi:hypothetical protein
VCGAVDLSGHALGGLVERLDGSGIEERQRAAGQGEVVLEVGG